MRYMGIDYGEKRVGVALSDDEGRFAFPHGVIKNNRMLLKKISALAKKENVARVVIGESRDYSGKPNPILRYIELFKNALQQAGDWDVLLEPEFLTSAEAERIQGKHETIDASAAALILKSYLDKNNAVM